MDLVKIFLKRCLPRRINIFVKFQVRRFKFDVNRLVKSIKCMINLLIK